MTMNKGQQHSEESKRKMSLAKIGNKNAFGKRSEETKKRMVLIYPAEAKLKISLAKKGRPNPHSVFIKNHPHYRPWLGKHHSEETKRKISLASKNLKNKYKDYCELCGDYAGITRDHDHITGIIRGKLCYPCNLAIGHLETRLMRIGLDKVASWLERGLEHKNSFDSTDEGDKVETKDFQLEFEKKQKQISENRVKGLCENCHKRPATEDWTGEGGILAFVHGMYSRWCSVCVLRTQIKFAYERKDTIPQLEKELQIALEKYPD